MVFPTIYLSLKNSTTKTIFVCIRYSKGGGGSSKQNVFLHRSRQIKRFSFCNFLFPQYLPEINFLPEIALAIIGPNI